MNNSISGKTKFLGVIADPVWQARSPSMANGILAERDLLGQFVLVPMHVGTEGLAASIAGLRAIQNFAGAIVSMPHKIRILDMLDELSVSAQVVGAVNVIRRNADGRLVGTNLDGEGFVAGLRNAHYSVAGAKVLLAGAGGAAASIAFTLASQGVASICIHNRTEQNAERLAARIGSAFPEVHLTTNDDARKCYDYAINATPKGMNATNELAIPVSIVERSTVVAECVLAPEMTPLLNFALSIGKPIHSGVHMLSAQMELMLEFMGA